MSLTKNKKEIKRLSKDKKSKKMLWIFFWIFLLLVLMSIFVWWKISQKPAIGLIKSSKNSQPQETEKVVYERFEGKYLSFHHAQGYEVKNHEDLAQPSTNILESALLAEDSLVSKKIALTVENLAGRSMGDVGNYVMREKNPKLYLKQKKVSDFLGSVEFSKTENGIFEEDIFIPRDNFLVELSFTGALDDRDNFEAEIRDIIESIQFK